MADQAPSEAGPAVPAPGPRTDSPHWIRTCENLVVALCLAIMVALPLTDFVLRFFQKNITGAGAFLQHFTLIIGMFGSALATREGRLLSISTLTAFLKGAWKNGAETIATAFAVIVTVFLAVGSVQFVGFEREGGNILAYGIPIWCLQLVLPLGFMIIAVRLAWQTSKNWTGQLIALITAILVTWLIIAPPDAPENFVVPGLIIVGVATFLGAPIFTVLGGAALLLFWGDGLPIASIPLTHYSLVTNPILPTIPLFTIAGYFLAEGKSSTRLVQVFQALVGGIRGGSAIVTALVCAFFTSFTGASGVTILALGGLLMPVLLAAKYQERTALGLITGSGSLGLLFPPSLPLILYAVVASSNAAVGGVTIQKMFLGGLLPGILMVGLTAAWATRRAPAIDRTEGAFDWNEVRKALWLAKWELLVPVVALGALFSGYFTPVEAAAATALYAFLIVTLIHRELNLFKDIPRVMAECGLLVGGVLLILGVALGLTNYLIDAQIPEVAVEWVTANIDSKWVFLIALNVVLLLVGCLMDIFSAIVVVVPLLLPLGVAFGIDPIHLGIIFLANLQLGYLTPPVGMNLFLSAYRFKKPVLAVARAALPMLFVFLVGVLLITYIPFLTTWLPNWLMPDTATQP